MPVRVKFREKRTSSAEIKIDANNVCEMEVAIRILFAEGAGLRASMSAEPSKWTQIEVSWKTYTKRYRFVEPQIIFDIADGKIGIKDVLVNVLPDEAVHATILTDVVWLRDVEGETAGYIDPRTDRRSYLRFKHEIETEWRTEPDEDYGVVYHRPADD